MGRLREAIRRYLGIDLIASVLSELESAMATTKEQLDAANGKLDTLMNDVRAALAALNANSGKLDAEAQQALDDLNTKLDSYDTEVGDADGSNTPPPAV
jgi:uncharacterized coiled-coil protein SlyX